METPRLVRRREGGFSMVELLVATVILSVGVLGLLSLQLVSFAQGSQSRHRGTATLLAHNLLDRAVAEGLLASAERYKNNGTVPALGWTYVDPNGLSAHASSAAENLYFDIKGKQLTDPNDPEKAFTVSWQRLAGVRPWPSSWVAFQPFIVNVNWREGGNNTAPIQHYFSTSRNVRL